MQVTGEEAIQPCTSCRREPGPWGSCVVISSKVPQSTMETRTECANCVHKGGEAMAKCSVGWAAFRVSTADSTKQHASQPSQSYTPVTNHGFSGASGSSGSKKRKANADSEPPRRKPEGVFRRARDTRHPIFSLTQHVASNAKQKGPTDDGGLFVDDDDDISMVDAPQPQNERETPVPPRVNENHNPVSGQAQVRVRSPVAAQNWEVAPGRIRSNAAESMENIAFSAACFRGSRPVQITRELFFRVIRLEMGETLQMEPDDKTCACSLATGKLAVTLPGEPRFEIGHHGVFIVKAGAAVMITNKHYDTAVLHVTAIEE